MFDKGEYKHTWQRHCAISPPDQLADEAHMWRAEGILQGKWLEFLDANELKDSNGYFNLENSTYIWNTHIHEQMDRNLILKNTAQILFPPWPPC